MVALLLACRAAAVTVATPHASRSGPPCARSCGLYSLVIDDGEPGGAPMHARACQQQFPPCDRTWRRQRWAGCLVSQLAARELAMTPLTQRSAVPLLTLPQGPHRTSILPRTSG